MIVAAGLIAFALVPAMAAAQIIRPDTTPVVIPAVATPSEPTRMSPIDRARYEQDQFEQFRHVNLPKLAPQLPRTCLEPVGRFCYFLNDQLNIPAELAPVTARRLKLLAAFDSLAKVMPGSVWIAEQRVRYLTEAGKNREALEVARACAPASRGGWRCEVLVGFSLHLLGDYAGAERIYDLALAAMDQKQRCAWTNIIPLLDDQALMQYRSIPCGHADRAAFEGRVWALARNLYSMEGNDSRTEYLARMTMVQLLSDATVPFQFKFDTDEVDRLLRFGWPRGWGAGFVLPFVVSTVKAGEGDGQPNAPGGPGSIFVPRGRGRGGTPVGSLPPGTKVPSNVPPRQRPPDITGPRGLPGNMGGPPDARTPLPSLPSIKVQARQDDGINVISFEPNPALRFIPPGFALGDATQTDSTPWRAQEAPAIARYAPAYAKTIVPLDHQQAVFKRGDSALVVLAYDTRGNEAIGGAKISAGLVVLSGRNGYRDHGTVREGAAPNGTLTVRAPWGPLLMSAEVGAAGPRVIARARYGIGPLRGAPQRVILSDVLLFRPNGSAPTSVETATPLALANERLRANEKLGVYWEAYGTDPDGEAMKISVVVLREAGEGSLLQRMRGGLASSRDETPVRVSVNDQSARGSTTTPRALELDISTLSPGTYVVQLELEMAGNLTVRTERRISIIR